MSISLHVAFPPLVTWYSRDILSKPKNPKSPNNFTLTFYLLLKSP